MEMKHIIEKVNYYSALAKVRELTDQEQKEREHHRKLYIEQFKNQVKGHLDNIKIVDADKMEEKK
ncbi:MAG: DUF896 domain-containing protein [Fusobacteriaceae bacterium]